MAAAHPPYTSDEARARDTFLALLWALAHPGQPHALPASDAVPAIALPALALLDLETTFHTPDASLAALCAGTTALAAPPSEAAYHIHPVCDDAALTALAEASVGTLLAPDTSATLIVGCTLNAPGAPPVTLRGPGVATAITVWADVPGTFWALRAERARYPLGWDVFLVDAAACVVVGLPRSSAITVGEEV